MKKQTISLKTERETLILVIKELVSATALPVSMKIMAVLPNYIGKLFSMRKCSLAISVVK